MYKSIRIVVLSYLKKSKKSKILLLFLFAAMFVNFSYSQSISVDANSTRQYISMMGADMERSAKNLHNVATNKDSIIKWVVKDIPMNTFRVRYDKLQEMEEGTKNFETYIPDVAIMQDMLALNPNLKFFATLKSDYGGYNQGNHNNYPTFIYDYANVNGVDTGSKTFDTDKYAIFLTDYLEYMEDQGVAITYLATAKESVQDVTAPRAKAIIEKLITETASRGVAMPLIVDAGTWSISSGINLVNNYVNLDINKYVHGYSSHDFWSKETKTWSDFTAAISQTGKHAYADETNAGGAGFIPLDQEEGAPPLYRYAQKCEFYEAGIEGELMFEIWPRGVNELSANGYYAKPIFFHETRIGRRMMAYYVMKKFMTETVDAHYIKPTTSTLTDVSTMAFKKDGKITLWVINNGDVSYENLRINISNLDLEKGMSVSQVYWEEGMDITGINSKLIATKNGSFNAVIKAKNMYCFDITPNIKITSSYRFNDTGNWIDNQNQIIADEGSTLNISPYVDANLEVLEWNWVGPNGYTANTKNVNITNIASSNSGEYTVTATTSSGVSESLKINILINCTTSPALTAKYSIDNGTVENGTTVNVTTKQDLLLAPEASVTGTWSWSGPNNFSSSDAVINLSNIHLNVAGDYVATFTSNSGCSEVVVYKVNVNCAPITILPKFQIEGEAVQESINIDLLEGKAVTLMPDISEEGTSSWAGPNGFSSGDNQILLSSGTLIPGDYVLNFISLNGCTSTITYNLKINCLVAPTLTPWYRVDGKWYKKSNATVAIGAKIEFGPNPNNTGTWDWTGPNGLVLNASNRLTLEFVTKDMAGEYIGTYTKPTGCSNTLTYTLSVLDECADISLIPSYQINEGDWVNSNTVSLEQGKDIVIKTQPSPTSGIWKWTGPNNFTSSASQFSLIDTKENMSGDYLVTYTSSDRCTYTTTISVNITGNCPPVNFRPYYQINGGAWVNKANAVVDEGDTIKLGPQPNINAPWEWVGPNGFTHSGRQFTINNITPDMAGDYLATYSYTSDGNACSDVLTMNIQVNATLSISDNKDFSSVVSLYPNPSTQGQVTINFGSSNIAKTAKIQILNLTGKTIFNNEMDILNQKIDLKLNSLKTVGFYLVKVSVLDKYRTFKLIVQ